LAPPLVGEVGRGTPSGSPYKGENSKTPPNPYKKQKLS